MDEADLKGAFLSGTHLERTDLRGTVGLNREQLAKVIIDNETILPDYLQKPVPKAKEPKGNDEL